MKRLAVACCLIALGCGGTTKNGEPPVAGKATSLPTSTAGSALDAQKKTMTSYEQAWDVQDAEKASTAYAQDGVVAMAGAPAVSGRAAIKGLLGAMFAGAKGSKTPFVRTLWLGNVMIGEWVWSGTQTGPMMGMPSTGKSFGVSGVSIYVFDAKALLKDVRVYFDMPTLSAQLGVSKQPARAVVPLPTDKATVIVAANTADDKRNVATARKLMDAFASRSEADFLASFTDDAAWDDMTQPTTMKGKAAAKKVFQELTTAFPDVKINVQNMWAAGDYVVVESTMTGTHKGAMGPLQPTNKAINLHGLDVLQFNKDGKIVRGWSYGNSLEMMMQLGMMPGAKKPS